MKKFLLLSFVLFHFLTAFSQELQSTVYNKKGKLLQRNRVNAFGKLESDINGIAIMKYEYSKGNLEKKLYFDKDEKPYLPDTTNPRQLPEFPSYTIYRYDSDDRLVQVSNHHANGALMDLSEHPAIKVLKYNNKGLLSEELYFNKKGKPTGVGEYDIAVRKYVYNYKGLLTEERSYDKDNRILDFGMNIAQHFYDNYNKKIKTAYFFANSDLYHTDLFFYNNDGQLIKEESHNRTGKLEYEVSFFYDSHQQLYKREYKYPDGKIVTQKQGLQLKLPGWKIANDVTIRDVKDVDGEGALLITVDKATGKITEVKNSSCKTSLMYAAYPYIQKLQLVRDEKESQPAVRGEVKVCILNFDRLVEEY